MERRERPEVTPDLRLRAERPRVTRLSRKVLIGLGGAARPRRRRGADLRAANRAAPIRRPRTLHDRQPHHGRWPDRTAARLHRRSTICGPPLPGDLGRPILNAQNQGQPVPPTGRLPQPGVRPRSSGVAGDRGGAMSQLFASTEFRSQPSPPATAAASATSGTTLAVPAEAPPLDPIAMQNMQDRKLAFLNGPVDRRTVSAGSSRTRVALCRAGRHRHPGGADHRHPLRSARPGHGAGHGDMSMTARPANSC